MEEMFIDISIYLSISCPENCTRYKDNIFSTLRIYQLKRNIKNCNLLHHICK